MAYCGQYHLPVELRGWVRRLDSVSLGELRPAETFVCVLFFLLPPFRKDLAYFDGLNEVILAAGLIQPKPGVFQSHIQFLLCLTTAVEIIILGVSFTGKPLFPLPPSSSSALSPISQLSRLMCTVRCSCNRLLFSTSPPTMSVC